MRDYKIRLDYAALRATQVATDPFPHVVVPHFVPPAPLRAVLADLPPLNKPGSYPADAVRAGPAAHALMKALEGSELREAIAEKFGLDLERSPTMRRCGASPAIRATPPWPERCWAPLADARRSPRATGWR